MLKESKLCFSIVAGLAFCLLVGCGGGGGESTISSRTPDSVVTPEPPDTSLTPDPVIATNPTPLAIPKRPEEPDTKPDEPDEPDDRILLPDPPDSVILPTTGLLNEAKFNLVKAPQAWGEGENGYTGRGVVVGVMEEVNPFHVLFGSGDDSKIHPDSILTSPYPDNLPTPPDKYIAKNEDELVMNDKSPTGKNPRVKKYPPVSCLLQFDEVDDCPDTSGNTKYFLRDKEGVLQVLPGMNDPNPEVHQCPTFVLEEDGEPQKFCPQFSLGHGTGVAGIAASNSDFLLPGGKGERSHAGFQGVAPSADILVYARPLEIAGLPSSLEEHATYFRNAPAEADVYNFSHSFSRMVTEKNTDFADFAPIVDAIIDKDIPVIAGTGNDYEKFPRYPAALPYFFPDLRGKILAVMSVYDDGDRTSYANKCGELPADWNPQEHGRHYCLAAPGGESQDERFLLAGPDNEKFHRGYGTSFATPVVTGAFAILKERFRNKDGMDSMSNEQLIFRLVDTAKTTNCTNAITRSTRGQCDFLEDGKLSTANYSDVSTYGAGLLDIEAAITPVGRQRMSAFGDIKEGITYEFDVTSLTTSAAFGDALQRAFQTHEIVAFDELDAPFWYPLSSLVATTSIHETLQQRHARLFEHDNPPVETAIGGRLALKSSHTGSSEQIDMSLRQPIDSASQAELLLTAGDLSISPFGLHEDKSFAHPYLGFAGEGIGLGGALQLGAGRLTAMGFTSGSADVSRDVPIDAHGGLIEYAFEPLTGIEFGMQAGAMVEESRALGLLSEGGFGELGESSTAFAGVSLDSELKDSWRFRASMLFGRTNLDEPSIGLLKTSTALTSSAFRFAVEGSDVFMEADRMDVFVAQPLRIEGGNADFTIPVGRTPAGLVRREQIKGVSLEPGGRELEFGMRYEMQVSEDITATGGLGIVHEGGHSKHTETEIYGLANLRFQF